MRKVFATEEVAQLSIKIKYTQLLVTHEMPLSNYSLNDRVQRTLSVISFLVSSCCKNRKSLPWGILSSTSYGTCFLDGDWWQPIQALFDNYHQIPLIQVFVLLLFALSWRRARSTPKVQQAHSTRAEGGGRGEEQFLSLPSDPFIYYAV